MHKTLHESIDFVRVLAEELVSITGVEIVVCPPFVALAAVHDVLRHTSLKVGAQNVHDATHGAFTGNISILMLRGLVDYVIVGHSEVRQYLGDTDETINRKIKAILANEMRPIIAVGESLAQNEAGHTDSFIEGQVRAALADIPAEAMANIVIAYEPIWAIGTGRSASGMQANAVIGGIRATLSALYGETIAASVRIQYGGSVKPGNMREFMEQPEIDGALVGGASLDAADFVALTRIAAEAKSTSAPGLSS